MRERRIIFQVEKSRFLSPARTSPRRRVAEKLDCTSPQLASLTQRMRLHLLLVAFSACASTALTLLGGPQLACAEASTASRRPRPLLLSAAPPPPPSHGSSKISVSNEMLAIGLPALAGLAVDPVASLVDTGFVGRMCGSGPLAGAAVASEWGRPSNLEPGSHPSAGQIPSANLLAPCPFRAHPVSGLRSASCRVQPRVQVVQLPLAHDDLARRRGGRLERRARARRVHASNGRRRLLRAHRRARWRRAHRRGHGVLRLAAARRPRRPEEQRAARARLAVTLALILTLA